MARRALGRGLEALIPNASRVLESERATREPASKGETADESSRSAASGSVADAHHGQAEAGVEDISTGDRSTGTANDDVKGEGVAGGDRAEEGGAPRGGGNAVVAGSGAGPEVEPSRSLVPGMPRAGQAAERAAPPLGGREAPAAASAAPAPPGAAAPPTPPSTTPARAAGRRALASGRAAAVIEIAVDRIGANPYQPRARFDDEQLEELVNSIVSKGVLQPVLVRRRGLGYELIAGERRMRAARRAGLDTVPAIVRDARDDEMLEIAIIENQQRVDLNPIESAEAYERAIEEFSLTTDELATIVGKDRSTIANLLRLLKLPEEVQRMVREGALDMGHARALAGAASATRALALARRAVRSGLSVRAIENLVRDPDRKAPRQRRVDPEVSRFEDRLRQRFGTQVRISRRGGRGKVEIEFYSQEDLERILGELEVLGGG